ncbi:MAG: hypothetical protein Q4F23_02145 [Coriobacteriia bacterium]|nr:hypothetical protein [Coriobacteriia bacterium]
MNEAALEMLGTLRARLDDLEVVIGECPVDLEGYDAKIDAVDTQVYVLQTRIEALTAKAKAGEEVTSDLAGDSSGTAGSVIPDALKDGVTDAVQMAGELARDAKPIVSEITGTVNDLKEVFSISGRGAKTPFKK